MLLMKTDEIVEPPLYVYPPPEVDMPISAVTKVGLFDNMSLSCHLCSPGRHAAHDGEERYMLITILL